MDFVIGEILCDRYQIKKRLGNGYWGVTYLVADLQADNTNNSECVVKQIKPAQSLSFEEKKAYFEREIKALQILGEHPQIPSFKNSFSDGKYFYIVQEYIVGDVLKEKIKPGKRLSEKEVEKLLIALLGIAKFIHENQHIHRDLKPDNIIQRPNGSLVIIDFGTVKEINTLDRINSKDTLSKLIGSSPYIAPERLLFPRPKEFDKHPRIDIYALGIIGLQAITGLAPDSLLIDPHNDGARLWSDAIKISPRIKRILNKMAHPNYKSSCRYQDVEEVLQDLTEVPANILDRLFQKINYYCDRNDPNSQGQGVKTARQLVKISSLLGVIGHYTSNVTIKTVDIYNQSQITLISPTSSSKKLIDPQQPRPFFFRTIPSVKVHAEALANYLINNLQNKEAIIFYNPDPESFSYSYWKEFKSRFENKKGKVVLEYNNFNSPQFNPQQTIQAIDLQYPDAALVLLPDGQITKSFSFNNAQKIIQLNQNKHWIVGAESLYNSQALELNRDLVSQKLVFAIPWHSSNNLNSNFVLESQQIWLGNISYRTAFSYDATRVFIQALQQLKLAKPTSKEIQKTIADSNFSTQGATGTVEFSPQGEREGQNVQLVTIMDCNPKIFVALERQECY